MKTKNIFRFLPVAALMLFAAAACTEQFDNPAPAKVWTQEEIEAQGVEFMSIWDFKQKYFYDKHGYEKGGEANYAIIEEDVAIKGKIISTDRYGNLYRSFYIQDIRESSTDEASAIEVKIGLRNLYHDYKVGQIVYIKAKGLVIGNYRYMLSLGTAPDKDSEYANNYIDRDYIVDQQILRGEVVGLNDLDYLVIDETNVSSLQGGMAGTNTLPKDLGRLVRFVGMKSRFGSGAGFGDGFSNTDIYPSFLQSTTTMVAGVPTTIYNNRITEEVLTAWRNYFNGTGARPAFPMPNIERVLDEATGKYVTKIVPDAPAWAFKSTGHNYYGSALFTLGSVGFVVRTSAYSTFAQEPLPADGSTVDMVALLTKYSSSNGGFVKYQLVLNNSDDVVITAEP